MSHSHGKKKEERKEAETKSAREKIQSDNLLLNLECVGDGPRVGDGSCVGDGEKIRSDNLLLNLGGPPNLAFGSHLPAGFSPHPSRSGGSGGSGGSSSGDRAISRRHSTDVIISPPPNRSLDPNPIVLTLTL